MNSRPWMVSTVFLPAVCAGETNNKADATKIQ